MAMTALQFRGGHRKDQGAHPKAESCSQATWRGTCALLLLPRPRSRGEEVFTFRVFRKGKSGNRWPLHLLSICRMPGVTDRCGFCPVTPQGGIIIPDFIKETLGAQVAKP